MSIIIQIDDQKVDVTTLSTARILELYNQLAFELDKPQVKRFATRPKAEGRLIGIADEARQKGKATKQGLMFQGKLDEHQQAKSKGKTVTAADVFDNPTGWLGNGSKPAEKPAPASTPAPTPAPTAAPAAGTARWAKPKKEPASKIAYRPRPGSSQAMMYGLLARPEGIDIQDFCDIMKGEGIKDKTLHTPPSVWSCLRYLFVTSKGYGLSFDGSRIRLLVPADERDAAGSGKKA